MAAVGVAAGVSGVAVAELRIRLMTIRTMEYERMIANNPMMDQVRCFLACSIFSAS